VSELSGSSPVSPSPSRKGWQPGLLAGMFVGILFVLLVGTVIIIVIPRFTAPQTSAGNAIDPSAATFITDIATTSSVDPQTAEPGPLTQRFTTSATIYVVFHLNLKSFDFKTHPAVYVQAKFYGDKVYIYQRMLIFTQQVPGGFFAVQYYQPKAGNVELYWCLKSDCSDGKLAQTASFTVVA